MRSTSRGASSSASRTRSWRRSLTGTRNAVLLTQAPTGTTLLLAGVSSWDRARLDFAMVRRDARGARPLPSPLQEWKDAHPGPGGRCPGLPCLRQRPHPPRGARVVQAKVQKHRLDLQDGERPQRPHRGAGPGAVHQGLRLRLQGVTYFRDGCREGVPSHIESKGPAPAQVPEGGEASGAAEAKGTPRRGGCSWASPLAGRRSRGHPKP